MSQVPMIVAAKAAEFSQGKQTPGLLAMARVSLGTSLSRYVDIKSDDLVKAIGELTVMDNPVTLGLANALLQPVA